MGYKKNLWEGMAKRFMDEKIKDGFSPIELEHDYIDDAFEKSKRIATKLDNGVLKILVINRSLSPNSTLMCRTHEIDLASGSEKVAEDILSMFAYSAISKKEAYSLIYELQFAFDDTLDSQKEK